MPNIHVCCMGRGFEIEMFFLALVGLASVRFQHLFILLHSFISFTVLQFTFDIYIIRICQTNRTQIVSARKGR